MRRQLKTLACIFSILAFFSFNSLVIAQNDIPVAREDGQIEYPNETGIDEQMQVKDLDIDPINTDSVRKTVVPNPKSEGKKVIGLFLKTMLIVAFSAVILYLVLYFVRKFYGSAFVESNIESDVESLDLSTPNTKQDALKSFLNRTKE